MNSSDSVAVRPVPQASEAQQRVLDRMAAQRKRLHERRLQRERVLKTAFGDQVLAPDAPMVLRVGVFAKQHPVFVAALAGVALCIGPKKLLRWVGVALPLLVRLKSR